MAPSLTGDSSAVPSEGVPTRPVDITLGRLILSLERGSTTTTRSTRVGDTPCIALILPLGPPSGVTPKRPLSAQGITGVASILRVDTVPPKEEDRPSIRVGGAGSPTRVDGVVKVQRPSRPR